MNYYEATSGPYYEQIGADTIEDAIEIVKEAYEEIVDVATTFSIRKMDLNGDGILDEDTFTVEPKAKTA